MTFATSLSALDRFVVGNQHAIVLWVNSETCHKPDMRPIKKPSQVAGRFSLVEAAGIEPDGGLITNH